MSGLVINYQKSVLIPINISDSEARCLSQELKCPVSCLPMKYLGIQIEANPRRIETWKPVLDKIEKKLSKWKSGLLSRAGRITMIRAVVNHLPLYYLSLFKLPKTVAKKIISLQSDFFWGSKDRRKKMPTIKLCDIQKPKEFGGLGVGDITIKNAALLFKW
ncbi:Putative ribonuclease H protein [Arachis hypogaea]|nr:Putative ribonuclease H protein [Arachis hypogaea]